MDEYSNTSSGARITMRKSRGTVFTPTTIISGDTLASWTASGYNGTNFIDAGKVLVSSTGTITSGATGAVPTIMQLQTMNAEGVLTTGLTIDQNQITTLAHPLPIGSGGTNGTAVPTAGAVAYGTGTAYAFTAVGVTGTFLQSQGAAEPIWTSTILATTVPISGLLAATKTNTINNAAFTQDWQWTLVAGGGNGLTITENTAATGSVGGYMFSAGTISAPATIDYTNLTGGTFSVGNTITGSNSGATATIVTDNGSNTLTYNTLVGTFVIGETISNGLGVSAKITSLGGSTAKVIDIVSQGSPVINVDGAVGGGNVVIGTGTGIGGTPVLAGGVTIATGTGNISITSGTSTIVNGTVLIGGAGPTTSANTINYANLLGGTFTVGNTITGSTSGATAVIATDNGSNLLTFTPPSVGSFKIGEIITSAGVSATVVKAPSILGTITLGDAFSANTQTINIASSGASATTQTVNIGAGLGTNTVNISTNTSAINQAVNIGASASTNSVTINFGSGNFLAQGLVASTITLGSTTQTGTITIGRSTGTNIINIGAGATGSTTINVSSSTGGAVNIGTSMVAGTITLGGTGQTGTITIGQFTGGVGLTQDINIGIGAIPSGKQIINIGTGLQSSASAAIVVGSNAATNTTAVSVLAGGNLILDGTPTSKITIGTTINNTGTTTGSITIGGVAVTGTNAIQDAINIGSSYQPQEP